MADTPVDVLIIGAGIAGTSLAVALHRLGRSVLLVERQRRLTRCFRGEFLQAPAVRALTELGFGAVVDGPHALVVRSLRVRDARSGEARLLHTGAGGAARTMPHHRLIAGLRRRARSALGRRFVQGAVARPAGALGEEFLAAPRLSLRLADGRERSLAPRWVVGCDGRLSAVRRWMGGASSAALAAPDPAAGPALIAGALLRGASPQPDRVEVIRTRDDGALAFFDLAGGRRRLSWNLPLPLARRGRRAVLERLRGLLGALAGWVGSAPIIPRSVAISPTWSDWLGPAQRGRLLLAGDALAMTIPFGGYGIRCATEHACELAAVLGGEPEPGGPELAAYAASCRSLYLESWLRSTMTYHAIWRGSEAA